MTFPAAAGDHLPPDLPGQHELAGEVDLEDPVPRRVGVVDGGRPLDGARVVDQDVDRDGRRPAARRARRPRRGRRSRRGDPRTSCRDPRRRPAPRCPTGSSDALTPTMSAPAAASAVAIARPSPRRAPVTTARRPRRSKLERPAGCPAAGHGVRPARQSMRTFITRPPWARLSNAAGASASAVGPRDQRVHRDRPLHQEVDGGREVGALVDACAEDLQLLPEDPLHVDLPRFRVDADRHEPAAGAEGVHREVEAGLGAGHLEGHCRAGALRPGLEPGGQVRRAGVDDLETQLLRRPSAGRGRARPGAPRAPRARATTAMSTPMGPPPTTRTDSPADERGAYDVVVGHRDRLDERRGAQRQVGWQRHQELLRHVPELLHRPGGVDADEVQAVADVGVARHGTSGTGRTSAAASPSPGLRPTSP